VSECEPLPVDLDNGQVEINGVELITPAWTLLNIRDLWVPRGYRGSDVKLPYVSGQQARRRRLDAAQYTLRMVMTGWYFEDGSQWPTYEIGLEENVDYLRSNVADPWTSTPYTINLTMPSGSVRTGTVTATAGMEIGEQVNDAMLFNIPIVIHEGVLEATS
jgi:hypothetical protein